MWQVRLFSPHRYLIQYVPERFFFPQTLLYKMNVTALNYKKKPPSLPQENTEQLVSLNSFYPKFQVTQTGGRR